MTRPLGEKQSFTTQQRWLLAVTIIASGMTFFAGIAITIALPTLQAAFDTGLTGLQWVVNAYVLVLATLLMIAGSLGDTLGQRRVFLVGLGIFGLGALLSSTAASLSYLIAWQAVQGLGAALLIPQSLALLNTHIPESVRGRAMGLWTGLSLAFATLGPFLAGWLIDQFSWQAIFIINAPVSAAVMWFTLRFVVSDPPHKQIPLDWLGTLTLAASLFTLSFSLIQGPVVGWTNTWILTSLVAAVVLLIIFIQTERRTQHPLVPLSLFRRSAVSGANAVTLFLYFALNGLIFFLMLNWQQVQGYSPTLAGLGFLPAMVPIILFSGWSGSLADRIGPRRQMIVGPLVVAAGLLWLTIPGTDARYFVDYLPGLLLQGTGMALTVAPLIKAALSVPPELSGAASGVNNALSRIASLLAIAILGAFMLSTFEPTLASRLTASELTADEQAAVLSQADKTAGIVIPDTFSSAAQITASEIVHSSFIAGFRGLMVINISLVLASSVIAFFTIRPTPSRS